MLAAFPYLAEDTSPNSGDKCYPVYSLRCLRWTTHHEFESWAGVEIRLRCADARAACWRLQRVQPVRQVTGGFGLNDDHALPFRWPPQVLVIRRALRSPTTKCTPINISRDDFHGEWNCTIAPNQQPLRSTYLPGGLHRLQVELDRARRPARSRGGSRAGSNGDKSMVVAVPSRISSATASAVAGAFRMPQTLCPVAT
jgi:hypothetical protein